MFTPDVIITQVQQNVDIATPIFFICELCTLLAAHRLYVSISQNWYSFLNEFHNRETGEKRGYDTQLLAVFILKAVCTWKSNALTCCKSSLYGWVLAPSYNIGWHNHVSCNNTIKSQYSRVYLPRYTQNNHVLHVSTPQAPNNYHHHHCLTNVQS